MGRRKCAHLARYEPGSAPVSLESEADAEIVVREHVADWMARSAIFNSVFDRATDEFVALIYLGRCDRDVPEFELGFFVDCEHEGMGYVTEAATAPNPVAWHWRATSRGTRETPMGRSAAR